MNDRERPFCDEEWAEDPDAMERIKAREFGTAEDAALTSTEVRQYVEWWIKP